MLYVCARDVMDAVFSVCIVTRGAVGASFVMQMVYVCILCLVCILWQCLMYDLQFVDAGQGCKGATIWKRYTPKTV